MGFGVKMLQNLQEKVTFLRGKKKIPKKIVKKKGDNKVKDVA